MSRSEECKGLFPSASEGTKADRLSGHCLEQTRLSGHCLEQTRLSGHCLEQTDSVDTGSSRQTQWTVGHWLEKRGTGPPSCTLVDSLGNVVPHLLCVQQLGFLSDIVFNDLQAEQPHARCTQCIHVWVYGLRPRPCSDASAGEG